MQLLPSQYLVIPEQSQNTIERDANKFNEIVEVNKSIKCAALASQLYALKKVVCCKSFSYVALPALHVSTSGIRTHHLLLPGQVRYHCAMGELQMVGTEMRSYPT